MKFNRSPLARILCGLCLLGLVLLAGCASSPTPVEQHFFSILTNTTPRVVASTNVVTLTNIIERVEMVTNKVNDVTAITITPIRDIITKDVVTIAYSTNLDVSYTYTANTNAGALVSTTRNVGNMFGPFGDLAAGILAGVFGIWGALRSRKADKYVDATGALAQSIEVFREVLKTTPQGQELNAKLTALMVKNQVTVGVIREVAKVVSTQVDNPDAKRTADMVLNSLPATP